MDKNVKESLISEEKRPEDEPGFTNSEGLVMIFKQSISPIVGQILHPMYMMINTMILGRILPDARCEGDTDFQEANPSHCVGPNVLQSAFGIGSATMGLILLAPGACYCLCLQNLIPQAFGSKNYELCGFYLNRVLITSTLIFVPILIPIQFSEHLFLWLGLGDEIAREASLYMRIASPGIICFLWGNGFLMFCSLQGKPFVNVINKLFPSLIHIWLAHHLAVTLDMRIRGIAIATLIHFILRFLFAMSYAFYKPELRKGLQPLTHPKSVENLSEVTSLGYHSFLNRVMGWWAFDVFTQLAGQVSNPENILAGQTNLRNIGLYTYMIPVGLSNAGTFFTGKYIGK